MIEYIDASKIKYSKMFKQQYADKRDIDDIPREDVEPVKHGSWIPRYENLFTPDEVAERTLVGYKCSECGRVIDTREEDAAKVVSSFPYCHCGAKMDAKETEE